MSTHHLPHVRSHDQRRGVLPTLRPQARMATVLVTPMEHLRPLPDVQRVQRLIQQYGLAALNPEIPLLLASIDISNPADLHHRLWQVLTSIVEELMEHLHSRKFLPGPPGMAAGDLTLGIVGQVPLRVSMQESPPHFLITGATGSGKTTMALHIAWQLAAR